MTHRSILLLVATTLCPQVNTATARTTIKPYATPVAAPDEVPPNDEPCGALMLEPIFGCLPRSYPMFDATVTGDTAPGVIGIPAAPCGLAPERDIWFTVVVPSNGELIFDMEATELNDAALALYTAQGSCAEGTLDLQPISGGCATEGSTYDENMPGLLVTALTPGDTLYLRVWQESGSDGDALICARRTDGPSSYCRFQLRLNDAQGDGWNGSYVRVCVGAVCTNHTIIGSEGFVYFGGNVGQIVTVNYFSIGGFQNQISYLLLANNGGLMYGSPMGPPPGLSYAFPINTNCNLPPAPQNTCTGAVEMCMSPVNDGIGNNLNWIDDLDSTNQGCFVNGEEFNGDWHHFPLCNPGTLAFTITPYDTLRDLNWAVWGPFPPQMSCPVNGPPIRCSRAQAPGVTGLSANATDVSEDDSGDGWLAPVINPGGSRFVLYVESDTSALIGYQINMITDPPNNINCWFSCLPTDIPSPEEPIPVTLQPNPARDRIELMNSALGPLQWEIRDSKGMLCGQGIENGPLSIPVAHLAPGLYMLRTVNADGSVRAYRWVKE